MALVIRLSKMGRKGERRFRLTVAEKRSRRDGNPIEYLGWYEKKATGIHKEIDTEKVKKWLSQGAKASPTVTKILES